jgi:hypothetical protein
MITAFLDHLETERHNTTRTRNLRLTSTWPRSSYGSGGLGFKQLLPVG